MWAFVALALASGTGASATQMRSRNRLHQLEEYVGDGSRFASAAEHAEIMKATKVARILQTTDDESKFNYFCKAGGGKNAALQGDERAVLKAWAEGFGLRVAGDKPKRGAYCSEVEKALLPMLEGGMMDKMRFCGAHGEICPEKPPCKPMMPQPSPCGCPGKMRPLPPPQATIDVPIPMLPCDYNCLCEPPPVISGLPCQDFLQKGIAYFQGSGLGVLFSGGQIPATSQARMLASCLIGKHLEPFGDLCQEMCYQKVLHNGNEFDELPVKHYYQAGCTTGCDKLTTEMTGMVVPTGPAVEPMFGEENGLEKKNMDDLDRLMTQAEPFMAVQRRNIQYRKDGGATGAVANAAGSVLGSIMP